MVVSVKCAARIRSAKTVHVRGIGFRSFVNTHPRRVAPPISIATGSVRPKPHVCPCGTMNAIQYQARMPTQGRIRLSGTSPMRTMRKTTSRSPLMNVPRRPRRFWALRSSFHRDALGEVARAVDVASPQYGDVVGQELERDDRDQR